MTDGFWIIEDESLGLTVDLTVMVLDPDAMEVMAPRVTRAVEAMAALESGAIANPDEGRRVGHYWLRNSALAPTAEMKAEIDETLEATLRFAEDVREGRIVAANGARFTDVLVVGI